MSRAQRDLLLWHRFGDGARFEFPLQLSSPWRELGPPLVLYGVMKRERERENSMVHMRYVQACKAFRKSRLCKILVARLSSGWVGWHPTQT